ncbi:CTP synthase [Spiroplasma endosymbiont of Nephrotoma flavescens]|uniref:CTP synthase n=1 Tax=Spiroplasma endosymbiont of Nephrotoma flavescens TaxID=3066302 RepID=UPI00313D3007
MTKYIFITGGVVSSLGKGIAGASIGHILKDSGLKVFMQKFDPYINVDPGTMNPYEHGEVFVTADGSETDLDLGHYERFIDENLTCYSSITAGKAYLEVIEKERNGDYEGKTVQVVPHLTDIIKNKIYLASTVSKADIIIGEIGGTVGDIESLPFIETIRQIRMEKGKENVLFIHVALVPFIAASGEFKTKPVQHSVKELLSLGIQSDIVLARSEQELSAQLIDKISLFCNVNRNAVFSAYDVDNIYKVPIVLYEQDILTTLASLLHLKIKHNNLKKLKLFLQKASDAKNKVITIYLVGKYIELPDAYLSVLESLKLAGYEKGVEVKVQWISANDIDENNYENIFKHCKGIIVPGGFGYRGIEGKILAAKYARKHHIPYFGICLGMQTALIEFAQDVCKLPDAHSEEFFPECKNPILHLIRGKNSTDHIGGTLRLGNYDITIEDKTHVSKLYKKKVIQERHRHRYEVNNDYLDLFKEKGIIFSGMYKEQFLVEIIELKNHPFFIGSQFHPEFTSRPSKSNPLFIGFIEAVIKAY